MMSDGDRANQRGNTDSSDVRINVRITIGFDKRPPALRKPDDGLWDQARNAYFAKTELSPDTPLKMLVDPHNRVVVMRVVHTDNGRRFTQPMCRVWPGGEIESGTLWGGDVWESSDPDLERKMSVDYGIIS